MERMFFDDKCVVRWFFDLYRIKQFFKPDQIVASAKANIIKVFMFAIEAILHNIKMQFGRR